MHIKASAALISDSKPTATMHLTLTNDDPMNTAMVDTETGEKLYEVETEKKFMRKVTIMRRSSSSNTSSTSVGDDVVAEVEWNRTRPSRVSFQSKKRMPLNMFLHNGSGIGIFKLWVAFTGISAWIDGGDSSRGFVAPDGKQYIWESKRDHLEVRCNMQTAIAPAYILFSWSRKIPTTWSHSRLCKGWMFRNLGLRSWTRLFSHLLLWRRRGEIGKVDTRKYYL